MQTVSFKKAILRNWPFFCLCLLVPPPRWMEVIRSATSSASRTRALSHKEPHAYWWLNKPPCWLSSSCWFSRGHLKLLSPSKFRKTYNLVKAKKQKSVWFCRNRCNSSAKLFKYASSPYVQTSVPPPQWLRLVPCLVFCHSVLFLACASIKILSLLECQMPKDILLPQRLHLKQKEKMTSQSEHFLLWGKHYFFSFHKNILFFFTMLICRLLDF